MKADFDKNPSLAGNKQFTTRFKDEIKLATLFREATSINELLLGLKKEMRNYFDAEAFTIYFADNKKILDQISIIRSKGLKNEMAGYITKFIKKEIRDEKVKQAQIESSQSEEPIQEEIPVESSESITSEEIPTETVAEPTLVEETTETPEEKTE